MIMLSDKYDFGPALVDLPHVVVLVLFDRFFDVIVRVTQSSAPLDRVSHRYLSGFSLDTHFTNDLENFVHFGHRSLTRIRLLIDGRLG